MGAKASHGEWSSLPNSTTTPSSFELSLALDERRRMAVARPRRIIVFTFR